MSLIDEAIRAILLANTTVSNIVGTRIYPLNLPLDCDFPALSYSKPSDPYNRIVGKPRFQIDCWAEDFTEVQNLKIAVQNALDGYSGTVLGINIEIIIPLDSVDTVEQNLGVYHIPYDFKIIYRR